MIVDWTHAAPTILAAFLESIDAPGDEPRRRPELHEAVEFAAGRDDPEAIGEP